SHALWDEQEPDVERVFVANDLVVERKQDQRAEQRHRQEEVRRDGGREATAGEEGEVDQGRPAASARVPDEECDEREPDRGGRERPRAAEPALVAGLGHAVEEESNSRAE